MWTQADVDALKLAIATGARRVRYADGRETEFRTLAEMERTLSIMQAEVAPSTVQPARYVVGYRSNLSA